MEQSRSRDEQARNMVILGRLSLGTGKSVVLIGVGKSKFLIAAGTETIHSMIQVECDCIELCQTGQGAK